ncbi:MAG: hemimethylated DNA binding protein, partial [Candidatus Omnitrophota bacterium]
MTDPNQLPYLINLLDDDAAEVRQSISKALQSYGPALQDEIQSLNLTITPNQKRLLKDIFFAHKVRRLKEVWSGWFSLANDYEKLETALSMISNFMGDAESGVSLSCSLDDLGAMYRQRYKESDPLTLAKYLFNEYHLHGDENDYYNPQNCNLARVIKGKKGIPITLTAVYILVGHRLGLEIDGCHFPGHFLARIKTDEGLTFIDCFSSGQLIQEEDIIRIEDKHLKDIRVILNEKVGVEVIVRRVLASLIRAYQLQEDEAGAKEFVELFKELDLRVIDSKIAELTPDDIIMSGVTLLKAGDVVNHKKYGYRGVIVDSDRECQSSDDWYYGNQTQPERSQTWYHVLVDGTDQVTYVAQSNLREDKEIKEASKI